MGCTGQLAETKTSKLIFCRKIGIRKSQKAIDRVSRTTGGVHKIVDVFEAQASVRRRSSAHSNKLSADDECKILADLRKVKPF